MELAISVLLGFSLLGYCIYLSKQPKSTKTRIQTQKEKYFEMMHLLNYPEHIIEEEFKEIHSYAALIEINKRLHKATKKLRNDNLRSGSDVLSR